MRENKLFKKFVALVLSLSLMLTLTFVIADDGITFAKEEVIQNKAEVNENTDYVQGEAVVLFKNTPNFNERKLKARVGGEFQITDTLWFEGQEQKTGKVAKNQVGGKCVAVIKSDKLTTQQLLLNFQQDSNVLIAEPNYMYKKEEVQLRPNDEFYFKQYAICEGNNYNATFINSRWEKGYTGKADDKNNVLAIIDTGVDYTHSDLKDNMWNNPLDKSILPGKYGYDFSNNDDDPMDDNGHGTHCAGIMGAKGNNKIGVAGVNWQTKIMALKGLDVDGIGYTSTFLKCYDYIQKAVDNGINITAINNSWGGGNPSKILQYACEKAYDKGVVSVFAAGNSGLDLDTTNSVSVRETPAVINVGAADKYGKKADFSNSSDCLVDIFAPGVEIYSTMSKLASQNVGNKPDTYEYLSGTSMAAPYVTGSMGLMKSIYPDMDNKEIAARLKGSARQLSSLSSHCSSGGNLSINCFEEPLPIIDTITRKDDKIYIDGWFFGSDKGRLQTKVNYKSIDSWTDKRIVLSCRTDLDINGELTLYTNQGLQTHSFFNLPLASKGEYETVGAIGEIFDSCDVVTDKETLFVVAYDLSLPKGYENNFKMFEYNTNTNEYTSILSDKFTDDPKKFISKSTTLKNGDFIYVYYELFDYINNPEYYLIKYDIKKHTWLKPLKVKQENLYNTSIVEVGGRMYIMGGFLIDEETQSLYYSHSVYILDEKTAELKSTTLNYFGTNSPLLCFANGSLYSFFTNDNVKKTNVSHIGNGKSWNEVEKFPEFRPPYGTEFSYFTGDCIPDGENIYFIGNHTKDFGDSLYYKTTGDYYMHLPYMFSDENALSLGAGIIGDYIYVASPESFDNNKTMIKRIKKLKTTYQKIIRGDVNGDEKITTLDALIILKDVSGMNSLTFDKVPNADYNDDKKITTVDSLMILRFVAKV